MKTEIYELRRRMEDMETAKKEFDERVSSLPASYQNSAATSPQLSARESIVVFTEPGNNWESAQKFVHDAISKAGLADPTDSFFKGEAFKGVLFCKYCDQASANLVINKLNRTKLLHEGRQIKCKIDLPVEQRSCLGFILGLRRQLIGWGFVRRNLKVNDEIPMLSVGGLPVVSASIEDSKIKINWQDPTWESWSDLVCDKGYLDLVSTANKRLEDSTKNKQKGDGKGYKGKQ
jgi:hypothetical protein